MSLHDCPSCKQPVETVYDSQGRRFGFACACKAMWVKVRKDAKWTVEAPS